MGRVSFFSPSIRPLSSHSLAPVAPVLPAAHPPGGERPGSAASLASVRLANRYHYETARMHGVWNTRPRSTDICAWPAIPGIIASIAGESDRGSKAETPLDLTLHPLIKTTHTHLQVVAETICGERNPICPLCLLVPCGSGMQRCNLVDAC